MGASSRCDAVNVHGIRRQLLSPAPLCLIWVGLIAGVDLIAAPAAFTVPGISRELALAVNRLTFETLNRAEWVMAGLTLILVLWTRPRRRVVVPFVLALSALALQSLWLLPELSARTDLILAGEELAPSRIHGVYGTLEVIKLLGLLTAGLLSIPRLTRHD